MRNMMGLGLLASMSVFAAPSVAFAQDNHHWPPPGVSFDGDPASPDLTGLWLGSVTAVPGVELAPNRGPADGRPPTFYAPWPLPYTAEYQKIQDDRAAAAKQGRALADITAQCLPFGLPRMLLSKFYPDEIVQTPGNVTIWVNSTFPVMIWTDGRAHPKDLKPSFNGHSIGYWVGDTLFVDTVGLNGRSGLDSERHPVSGDLRLKWSMRRVADDVIHVNVTLLDNKTFTEPVTTTNIWTRKTDPNWQVLDDSSCFENNLTKVDDKGTSDGFVKF